MITIKEIKSLTNDDLTHAISSLWKLKLLLPQNKQVAKALVEAFKEDNKRRAKK